MEPANDLLSTTLEGQHEAEAQNDQSQQPQTPSSQIDDAEEVRPPLPPRPETIDLLNEGNAFRTSSSRPNLQSHATTALSLTDITGQTNADGRDGFVAGFGRTLLGRGLRAKASLSQLNSARGSEAGDTASVISYAPNSEEGQDESLLGEFANESNLQDDSGKIEILGHDEYPQDGTEHEFVDEFEPIGELDEDGQNEGRH
ncbi:hypothetical protein EIK77_002974 [Talaromyces pinophilus]|nr:hypothetical protein EIK77_002974 [Talaromyces pinophilus]